MTIELTANEVRVLASLMEKSVFTPEQYPLTLNAVTLACNQKSSRDPVTNLDPGAVQHTLRTLESRHLVSSDGNSRGRAERFAQRLCNTPFSELALSQEEFAALTVLMLRGPQTPGEIRARSGRLFEFPDNAAVDATLDALIARPGGGLVARLPRKPNRQDAEYVHLFGGAIESAPREARVAPEDRGQARSHDVPRADRLAQLETRVGDLERELSELRDLLARRVE
jgi:uncharacterized protein